MGYTAGVDQLCVCEQWVTLLVLTDCVCEHWVTPLVLINLVWEQWVTPLRLLSVLGELGRMRFSKVKVRFKNNYLF